MYSNRPNAGNNYIGMYKFMTEVKVINISNNKNNMLPF